MGEAVGEELMQGLSSNPEKIFVSVRLRPLNEKEIARKDVSDWDCFSDNTVIYRNNSPVPDRSMYPNAYTFDKVFRWDCSTRQVYEEGAKEVALSVVNGINSSIFAYGQTSSGKTYTMSGITAYTVTDIYDYIDSHKEREFFLTFSAMEIYNESVRDLLSADSSPLRLLDDPDRGTIVERLTEETLTDWNDFKELLSVCEAQRQSGETSLNEESSRSHQILRLTIESSPTEFQDNDKSSTLMATVNFVDLAGSERASQSLSAGTRLKEGCHINRSLLTLGTVIRKLSKGRNGHIPFRDSKLTRILQSSLTGNARTAIICTMSPAQCHVEQSRNTLLFASCAKEVTTKAQVNIVMSDKALVKHLQKELARLEIEFTGSGPTSTALLLREKDLEIEKLKKENIEFALQKDLLLSQVQDLLRVIDNDRPPRVQSGRDHQYPQLRVRRSSWDYDNPVSDSDPQRLGVVSRSFHSSLYSGTSSRSSCENHIVLPDIEDNFQQSDTSPQLSVNFPYYVGTKLCQEETNKNLEDICKDVRCIEMEESSTTEQNKGTVASRVVQEILGSSRIKEDRASSNFHQDILVPSSEELSPSLGEVTVNSGIVKTIRHGIFIGSPVTSLSSHCFEEVEVNGSAPPVEFEKDFSPAPKVFTGKQSTLTYSAETQRLSGICSQFSLGSTAAEEMKLQIIETFDEKSSDTGLSKNGSRTSVRSPEVDELTVDTGLSRDAKDANHYTLVSSSMQTTELQKEKQLSDESLEQSGPTPTMTADNIKDVGLDPMHDDAESPSKWPLEFKRLQREIIQLWHACNVSLVHRTYFFLLFKGDPTDSVYMEVELRRLSFLKDTFSRGMGTIEDGQTLTLDSSMRGLRSERIWMTNQMLKTLSDDDRDNLYLKWGIELNSKHRRFQLAHRLWTDPNNTEHITESSAVVAKLVGFSNPEHAYKEMFRLNFAPRRTNRRFSSWKLRCEEFYHVTKYNM